MLPLHHTIEHCERAAHEGSKDITNIKSKETIQLAHIRVLGLRVIILEAHEYCGQGRCF